MAKFDLCYLRVAACTIVSAELSLRSTSVWLGPLAINNTHYVVLAGGKRRKRWDRNDRKNER